MFQGFYFFRIFAAAKCAAAELKSKVRSVSPQLAVHISLVTLFSPRQLRCAVMMRFCREKPLPAGALETGITQAILASLAHLGNIFR